MSSANLMRAASFAALVLLAVFARAEPSDAPVLGPVSAEDPEWKAWAASLAPTADITADFEELRTYSFRKEPVVLRGTTRISPSRGLSLEYREPEQRIVIVDRRGVLLRENGRDKAAPNDPRATAVNGAMLNILRFDLTALAAEFDVKGLRAEGNWTLELTPRSPTVAKAVRRIVVEGLARQVRRIALERSSRQAVVIDITPREEMTAFSAEELARFFRATE